MPDCTSADGHECWHGDATVRRHYRLVPVKLLSHALTTTQEGPKMNLYEYAPKHTPIQRQHTDADPFEPTRKRIQPWLLRVSMPGSRQRWGNPCHETSRAPKKSPIGYSES